ncbi:hypothetical protein L842_4171 [Mycobacterium intracellulare MIN_052511_1280]|nr:hypothetical protein L842_4171 [Mycobacterium intracellulare MIN_052511_1280]
MAMMPGRTELGVIPRELSSMAMVRIVPCRLAFDAAEAILPAAPLRKPRPLFGRHRMRWSVGIDDARDHHTYIGVGAEPLG